ncbi:MAG: outer membrane beta-barrel protein [Actinobacteria bacterium]|nr:outer membrane beta-barrel protein [Actinomycetota bacterium]
MKAAFVLLAFVLLQIQESSAQNYWEHKVGVNYSYLGKSENEATPGLVYGLEKGWQLNEHLYLSSAALVLIHYGTLLNETRQQEDIWPLRIIVRHINISYRVAYIGIPFYLRYKLDFSKSLSLYLESGPQFNLCIYSGGFEHLIKRKVFLRDKIKSYPFSTRFEYGNESRTIRRNSGFSLNIGLGTRFHHFDLEFLYSYPFNRIYNVGNLVIDEKMYAFSILLGYRIN